MVRVSYISPSTEQFALIFSIGGTVSRGGGVGDIRNFHSDVHYQKGSGIFSFLGNIARKSIPFLTNYIFPEVGNLVKNVVNDVSMGVPVKTAVKRHGVKALKNTGRRVIGSGKQKKKKIKKRRRNIKKKKQMKIQCGSSNDIFS